jgi:hypothetical protein
MQTVTTTIRRIGHAVLPQPWWLSVPMLVEIGLIAFLVSTIGWEMAALKARERQARHEWRQQQLEATQALVEEVRRLREVLEAREAVR